MFFLAELQSNDPDEYPSMFSSMTSAGERVRSMREPWPSWSSRRWMVLGFAERPSEAFMSQTQGTLNEGQEEDCVGSRGTGPQKGNRFVASPAGTGSRLTPAARSVRATMGDRARHTFAVLLLRRRIAHPPIAFATCRPAPSVLMTERRSCVLGQHGSAWARSSTSPNSPIVGGTL